MSEENNHIEQFFKKHLEVEQTSFMEEDWTKMEALLDEERLGTSGTDNGGIGIRRGLVILLLATSLAFILGWFLKDFKQNPKEVTNNHSVEITSAESQSSSDSEFETNQLNSSIKKTETKEASASTLVSSGENQTSDNEQQQNHLEGASSKNTSLTNSSEVKSRQNTIAERADQYSNAKELILDSSEKNVPDSKNRSNNSSYSNSQSSNRSSIISNDQHESTEEGLLPFQSNRTVDSSPNLSDQRHYDAYYVESLDEEFTDFILPYRLPDNLDSYWLLRTLSCPSAPKTFQWNRIAVGLAYAPDFNSLNFKGKLRATNKVGLRIFWKPLNRFELQSGVFFNKKKYTSPGEEYHPPAGYWGQNTGGVIPTWVNGSCSVIDIPVTIGFDFIQTKKWNWKVNGGLSNYILLDEEYQYEFNQPYTTTSWGWKTDENTTLMWSIMNASVAGEFLWRSRTSLVIEPFIQMPLQEIGWAQVSLYGYGVLFTIKQNLFTQNR